MVTVQRKKRRVGSRNLSLYFFAAGYLFAKSGDLFPNKLLVALGVSP